jgi:hypothetical protein
VIDVVFGQCAFTGGAPAFLKKFQAVDVVGRMRSFGGDLSRTPSLASCVALVWIFDIPS